MRPGGLSDFHHLGNSGGDRPCDPLSKSRGIARIKHIICFTEISSFFSHLVQSRVEQQISIRRHMEDIHISR